MFRLRFAGLGCVLAGLLCGCGRGPDAGGVGPANTTSAEAAQPAADPVLKGKPLSVWVRQVKEDKDLFARNDAFAAISEYGKTAPDLVVPIFLDFLEHPDASLSFQAGFDLPKLKPTEKSLPTLIRCVNHKKDGVRTWAVQSLGNLGPKARAALPTLEKAVDRKPFSDEITPDLNQMEVVNAISRINGQKPVFPSID